MSGLNWTSESLSKFILVLVLVVDHRTQDISRLLSTGSFC